MSEEEPEITLRRILVALDASEPSRAVLETAARLAASLESELVGLFVEDAELLQMSALPVTRLVSAHSKAPADLDLAVMERALRAQARLARESLARAASQWRVRWSFQVVRGATSERLLVEARGCDLVALGTTSGAGQLGRLLGSTARQTAVFAPCSVFLSRAEPPQSGPVTAVVQGNFQTLGFAGKLAQVFSRPLEVLAIGGTRAEAEALGQSCRTWLQGHELGAAVETLALDERADLVALLRGRKAALYVIDRQGPFVDRLHLEELVEQVDCPILLLR